MSPDSLINVLLVSMMSLVLARRCCVLGALPCLAGWSQLLRPQLAVAYRCNTNTRHGVSLVVVGVPGHTKTDRV
jgi:hypothetical protein